MLMASIFTTMLAYVVADLVLGTELQNVLRGWARVVFVGSNFIGLYFLCRRDPFNILRYSVAGAAGTIVYLAWTGRLLEDWKFGASVPLTVLIACLVPLAARRGVLAGSLALGAAGVLHIALDSREIGGNCLLSGMLLFARCSSVLRLKSLSWVVLGMLGMAGIGVFLCAYVLTEEEFGPRRQLSNAWRTASFMTAAAGISESPWMGNGSQANNFDLQSRYDSIFAERTGMRYRGHQTDTSTFSPHSQILQAWFEAGIFGMTFFLYLGWRLIKAAEWCIFRRDLDAFSVLFSFCLLRGIWHLLFSPFAGLARLDVALAAVVICVLQVQRNRYLRPPAFQRERTAATNVG
jgi:O-antigen ligase